MLVYPLDAIVKRLREQVPEARIVGVAADLQTALETPPNAAPALYVLATERGGKAHYTSGGLVQHCEVQITVVMLIRNASGERSGEGAKRRALDIASAVRRALLGWTPVDAANAIKFVASRDDTYLAGWYAGQDVYTTDYRMHA